MLRLLTYDYDTVAQEELDERARAMAEELRARGIKAADQGCEEGEPDRPARLRPHTATAVHVAARRAAAGA